MRGPDVSNWQGAVDWDEANNAGMVDFGIAKMSEGVTFVDKFFARNWSELGRLRKPRALYHYGLPSRNAAAAEANRVLALVAEFGGLATGDMVYLDMEDPDFPVGADVGPWCLEWLLRVEDRLGFAPGIYTYPSYVPERSLDELELARFPLWWADYDGTKGPFRGPWTGARLWQTTAFATVPGIGQNVDMNDFDGTPADWIAMGFNGKAWSAVPNPDPLTGFWIDPVFLPGYDLARYGRPQAGSAMYTDGVLRQRFEKLLMEWDGRGEPRVGAYGHALPLLASVGTPPDFPGIHPLLP